MTSNILMADPNNTINISSEATRFKPANNYESLKVCCNCLRPLMPALGPKLLPCLHIACTTCVQIMSSRAGTHKCPVCDQTVSIESCCDNFLFLSSGEFAERPCSNCIDGSSAAWECFECQEVLCNTCREAHLRVKQTREHRLTSLSNATQEALKCTAHPGELKQLYCQTCSVLTCRDCQLEHHKDHKYRYNKDIAPAVMEQYKKHVIENEHKVQNHKLLIDLATTRTMEVEAFQRERMENIRQLTATIIDAVTNRMNNLADQLKSVCAEITFQYNARRHRLQNSSCAIEQMYSLMDGMCKSDNSTMIMLLLPQVERQWKRLHAQVHDTQSLMLPVSMSIHLPDTAGISAPDCILPLIEKYGYIAVDGLRELMEGTILPQSVTNQSNQAQMPAMSSTMTSSPQSQNITDWRQLQSGSMPNMMTEQYSLNPAHQYIPQMLQTVPSKPPVYTGQHQAGSSTYTNTRKTASSTHRQVRALPGNMVTHHQQPQPREPGSVEPIIHQQHHYIQSYESIPNPSETPVNYEPQRKLIAGSPDQVCHSRTKVLGPSRRSIPWIESRESSQCVIVNGLLCSDQYSGEAQNPQSWKTQVRSELLNPQLSEEPMNVQVDHPRNFLISGETSPIPLTINRQINHEEEFENDQQRFSAESVILTNDVAKGLPIIQSVQSRSAEPIVTKVSTITVTTTPSITPQSSREGNVTPLNSTQPADSTTSKDTTLGVTVTDTECKYELTSSPGFKINENNSVITIDEDEDDVELVDIKADNVVSEDNAKTDPANMEIITSNSEDFASVSDDVSESSNGTDSSAWSDYCAVCNDGGLLVCCDTCDRVFHLSCHMPGLPEKPEAYWSCVFCKTVPAPMISSPISNTQQLVLTSNEFDLCEHILLKLYCFEQSKPFQVPVDVKEADAIGYYKFIHHPMDFMTIKHKLYNSQQKEKLRNSDDFYKDVQQFLGDLNQVFINCFIFNAYASPIWQHGKDTANIYKKLVEKHFPMLANLVRCEPTTAEIFKSGIGQQETFIDPSVRPTSSMSANERTNGSSRMERSRSPALSDSELLSAATSTSSTSVTSPLVTSLTVATNTYSTSVGSTMSRKRALCEVVDDLKQEAKRKVVQ